MKKILIGATVLLLSNVICAQTKVLWIGNSYTSVNNLPSLINQIATSLGDDITYDSNTPGGTTFEVHAGSNTTYQKINSNTWDVVVLQAQSQEPSFPHAQVNTNTYPYAEQMNDSIQASNSCAETMFYMTWGREQGDSQWDSISTFDRMNERLKNAYIQMANNNDASVAPVAIAWKYVRDHYPSIQLYSGDGSHPSYAGSYLVASVFYTNIFNKTVLPSDFIGSLDEQTAETLRRVADSTVFNGDFSQWRNGAKNAAHFSEVQNGLNVNFTSEAIGDDLTYKWLFGDGNESTVENPTYTYINEGDFEVSLISYSTCGNDTTTKTIQIELTSIEENQIKMNIEKLDQGLRLEFESSRMKMVELFSLNGTLLKRKSIGLIGELHFQRNSIYMLSVTDQEGNVYREKVSF